ncbi:sensor histidine kinase [Bacillus sp. DJP31]|uniref:sensor histidine kinase n=1 Tax=Bacillus sp. DJP31 TaxID=3409789 RepID=UPI003BB55957
MTLLSARTMSNVIHSIEEEHKRIAHELHEGIAQTLYSVYSGLQYIENKTEDKDLCKYTSEMTLMIERTIEELRWFSIDLYPASLSLQGAFAALRAYATIYTKTYGIEIQLLENDTKTTISSFQETLLFRICQDMLKAAAVYSETEKITILFEWNSYNVNITIFIKGIGKQIIQSREFQEEIKKAKVKALLINSEVTHGYKEEGEISIIISIPSGKEVIVDDKGLISG